jgi:hypothetical protein
MRIAATFSTVLLCLFSISSSFGEDVYFKKLEYFSQEGDKRVEHDARITFAKEDILITDQNHPEKMTYASIPISSITKMVYEKSSHPRWKTAIFLSPFALFAKGKKHWLTIQYQKPDKSDDFVFLRLDKDNYQMILATIEARTGKAVEKMLED